MVRRHLTLRALGAALTLAPAPLLAQEERGERAAPLDGIAFRLYGTFAVGAGSAFDGDAGVGSIRSRAGVTARARLTRGIVASARAETGVNLARRDTVLRFGGGDPNRSVGEDGEPLSLRLLWVKLASPLGDVSFGKQWAPYADVARFTDELDVWGGEGSGTFAARTDGGISGTGRADDALQYRLAAGPVRLAAQAQLRTLTDNDVSFADGWGASLVVMPVPWLDVGLAYHQVRDGVELPADDQPKEDDRAAVFGLRLARGRLRLAATYAMFEEHERDDLGVWFGGRGLELYGRFELVERWHAYAGWNSLDPNSDYEGRYELRYASGGVMRTFGPDGVSAAFVELRDDRTRLAGGGDRDGAAAAGLRLAF